jgi:hypothetical protein
MERKWQFNLLQAIGMPLLMLLPILALLGGFDERFTAANASGATVEMQVDYPVHLRYRTSQSIGVRLHNISEQPIPAITVRFGRTFMDQFSHIVFMPNVDTITEETYEVEIRDVPPGATRYVTVEIQGERYGRHRGVITAEPESGEEVQVQVETLIFP